MIEATTPRRLARGAVVVVVAVAALALLLPLLGGRAHLLRYAHDLSTRSGYVYDGQGDLQQHAPRAITDHATEQRIDVAGVRRSGSDGNYATARSSRTPLRACASIDGPTSDTSAQSPVPRRRSDVTDR